MGRPLQKADSGTLIHTMAKSFPVFLLETGSLIFSGNGNWLSATDLFEL
jgi:hypothetical protein